MPSRQHRGDRGQGLVEFALILPVIMFLFLGVYTASDLSGAKETVGHASREGARIAAEIGNNGYRTGSSAMTGCQSASTDPCIVDNEILKAVVPILSQQLSHTTVVEIDVYQPAPCTGGPCPPDNGAWQSPDLIDQYNPDGTVMTGSPQSYTLDKRTQIHPNEASIGVRIRFHYTSPTLRMFTMDLSEYAVIRLAPLFT